MVGNLMVVSKHSNEDRCPTWRAERRCHKRLPHVHTIRRQSIHFRGLEERVAHEAHRVPAMIIAEKVFAYPNYETGVGREWNQLTGVNRFNPAIKSK